MNPDRRRYNNVIELKLETYAAPLFESVNPNAQPLTVLTLVNAKYYEVMSHQ